MPIKGKNDSGGNGGKQGSVMDLTQGPVMETLLRFSFLFMLSVLFSMYFLIRHRDTFQADFRPAALRLDRSTAVQLSSIGIPMALFLLAPDLCFRLFTQDEEVLAYAGMSMFCLAIEMPAKALMPACSGLVNAQGFVQLSSAVAFLDAFAGRVFLCWFCGFYLNLGAFGFFLGYVLGTYVTSILVFVYYITGFWKKRAALV